MKALNHNSIGTLTRPGYTIEEQMGGQLAHGLKSLVRNLFDSWQLIGIDRLGEHFTAAADAQYLPEEFQELTNSEDFRGEVATVLGLHHSDLADGELEFLNAGLNSLVIPVKDLGTLMSIQPNQLELQQYMLDHSTDVLVIFTTGPNRVMRVFSSSDMEEEVTGPAVAALGYYLQGRILNWKQMKVFQYTADHCFNVIGLKWYLKKLYYAAFEIE